MSPSPVSRRGFLTKVAASIAAVIGGSAIGGISTWAWSRPLRVTPLTRGPLQRVGKPKSYVEVAVKEARRRELEASRLSEFQVLFDRLVKAGYKQTGVIGTDGVAGYALEGSKGCSVLFSKEKKGADVAVLATVWRDRTEKQACSQAESLSVAAVEAISPRALPGPTVLRSSFLDDGVLVTHESVVPDATEAVDCEPECHNHPPGWCPEPPACSGSEGVCQHCDLPTNLCEACNTNDTCLALCLFACSATPKPLWPACGGACYAACSSCSGWYCCDYKEAYCCEGTHAAFCNNGTCCYTVE